MSTPHDDAPVLDPQEPEQEFTICPHCGEDLPHHDCQNEEREPEEL